MTETEIELPLNGKKIYKDKAMYVASYVGGPLAAGYIIAMNYKAFGDNKNYKRTILLTLVATAVIYTLAFIIPEDVQIANYVFPITYTVLGFFIMRFLQGKQIDEHIKKGGFVFSWGRVFLVGLLWMLITLAFFLPYAIYFYAYETYSS